MICQGGEVSAVVAAAELGCSAALGLGMFKRLKPLVIQGREISDPVAIELVQYMTEDRALFVADLRVRREFTWRMVAEECARAWGKHWEARQDIGAALCMLAAAYMGEDSDFLDTM